MPHTVRTAIALLPIFIIACVVVGRAQAPASQPGGAALPKRASETLDKRFTGWRLASVDVAAGDACLTGLNGRSPSFATADLTSDGIADFALQIATADGVRLVALVGRLGGNFTLYEVVSLGPTSNRLLEVRARGTRYRRQGLAVEDFFGADTVLLTECGKSTTAYLWTGAGFRPVALVPST